MKLVKEEESTQVSCAECGKQGMSNKFYADIEGEPDKVYYCRKCVSRNYINEES